MIFYVVIVLLLNRNFQKQTRQFQEILVLHLVNGKDYFISVSGYLVQTSFGRQITDLVRIPDPIRRQNLLVDIEQVNFPPVPKKPTLSPIDFLA